jgi:hypothetical protein
MDVNEMLGVRESYQAPSKLMEILRDEGKTDNSDAKG